MGTVVVRCEECDKIEVECSCYNDDVQPKGKGFIKNDKIKTNLAILFDTGNALSDVADVMEFGANKYDRGNWRKVDDKERYIAAPLRHLLAYQQGEKIDPESGKSHLAHAICSLLFLLELDHETA